MNKELEDLLDALHWGNWQLISDPNNPDEILIQFATTVYELKDVTAR